MNFFFFLSFKSTYVHIYVYIVYTATIATIIDSRYSAIFNITQVESRKSKPVYGYLPTCRSNV